MLVGAASCFSFAKPKVQQLRSRLGEHDVAGFQIAMRDAFAMGFVQRVGNLDCKLQHLFRRQWTLLQTLRERLALQILHHQKISSILMAGVVERADVWMIQAGDGLCFAVEALAQIGAVGKVGGENLDGDDAIEACVPGAIHLSHSARTDGGEDFVWP